MAVRASNPELARVKSLVRGLLLVAVCLVGWSVVAFDNPPLPPYRGRLAWAAELAFALFGSAGIAFLWILAAAGVLLAARILWRHTPKTPQDRLF